MTHEEIVGAIAAGRRHPDYYKAERLQLRAHGRVAKAIRAGLMGKKPCAVCGESRAVAHHEDYTKELRVAWLCRSHHARRHAELRGQSDWGVWKSIGAAQPSVSWIDSVRAELAEATP